MLTFKKMPDSSFSLDFSSKVGKKGKKRKEGREGKEVGKEREGRKRKRRGGAGRLTDLLVNPLVNQLISQ